MSLTENLYSPSKHGRQETISKSNTNIVWQKHSKLTANLATRLARNTLGKEKSRYSCQYFTVSVKSFMKNLLMTKSSDCRSDLVKGQASRPYQSTGKHLLFGTFSDHKVTQLIRWRLNVIRRLGKLLHLTGHHLTTSNPGAQPTAEKLRGTKVWVPTPGRFQAGLGVGAGALWGSGSITPGKFLKTQMLNPAYLLWNFLLFENYGQEVGDQYIVGPQPKSWGTSLPRSLRLLRLCSNQILVRYKVATVCLPWVRVALLMMTLDHKLYANDAYAYTIPWWASGHFVP